MRQRLTARPLFAVLFALSGAHAPAGAGELTLKLRADVLLEGGQYALADIAEDAGHGAGMGSLGAVVLGPAPLVGQVARYSRAELDTALQGQLLANGQRVVWSGAERVHIRSRSQALDPALLLQLARDEVVARFDADGAGIDMQLVASLPPLAAPIGALTYRARLVDTGRLRPRMAVWVDVIAGDAVYRSVLVALAVTAPRAVLVARRALPMGAVATEDDFAEQLADVAMLDDVALQRPALAHGGRLRQTVAPGQVLQARHLTSDGMVLRGDRVQLRTAASGIAIETVAYAQADAVMGQQIRVRPERSSETVLARVTAPGTVSLDAR